MDRYTVTGMSCAACQAKVEKAVIAVEGVTNCAVNLLTNSMGVEGTASAEAVISAVKAAGYGAEYLQKSKNVMNTAMPTGMSNDTEISLMRKRLIASVVILLPLMYVSMGHMMWDWPLPEFLEENHVAMGIYELLLSSFVMVINQKFFINGFKGLIHKSPNMDTLVALGATASYGYSVYALFAMTREVLNGQTEAVMEYMNQFYFESAAMILTLITVGKMLEAKSKGKTTDALKSLMKLSPKSAVILDGDTEKTVPIDKVSVGDRFVIRPGDSIPVDGFVIDGHSAINESALTGESVPVDKQIGDHVYAATINTSGFIICEAEKVGEDTTIAEIIRLVSDAAATKAPIAKIADRVSGVFVPAVIIIALITLVVWMLVGQNVGYAIARAVSVLVISCPCALGLATPVAIMVGNGVAARNGILFKNSTAMEQTGKTKIVVLDKTGTITTGTMKVTDVIAINKVTECELLEVAYALEIKSEHPISKAVIDYAEKNKTKLMETMDFETYPGNGLRAKIHETEIFGGNESFICQICGANAEIPNDLIRKLANQGKTPILFARGVKLLGVIAVSDTIKEDSVEAIDELRSMGMHVVMLTGDNEITAQAIAHQVGVDEFVAQVKPNEKEAVIRKLKEYGKVIMVGDGINDAPALTTSDIGIAIGAGADIAIDAADVVLMKSSILDVYAAIRISRATIYNIYENLFWAFFYNIIGIPIAAGCYIAVFGWTLNPMFGAAAMALSSFCVVTNALRLNCVKPYKRCKKRISKKSTKRLLIHNNTNNADEIEEREEYATMKIMVKGMMCAHCEAHVKKALESIKGIETVIASHEDNLVTITTTGVVDETLIRATVTEAGYEYAGIAE